MTMFFKSLTLALLLTAVSSPVHAVEPRDIGTAVEIKNQVTAAQENVAKRRLSKQSPIHEQEVLETALNSRGEFVLADDTKLVLGPTARLVLDKFVYDPDQRAGNKVTVNFAKGAFRFISGGSGDRAYEIKAPLASLGVRGTKFDGYVADDGRMAVLLHQDLDETSQIEVCSTVTLERNCEVLRSRCHIIYVTSTGRVMPQRATWEASMLPGVGVQKAFPFLEQRLAVDPVSHCRYADLFTRPPILKKALAPAPMPAQPALVPPPPEPLPIPIIATFVAVPFVLMEINDSNPASP